MQLVRASLWLDGNKITQDDLDAYVRKQRGCVTRPQVIASIAGGEEAIEAWLTRQRLSTVIGWLTNVPLVIEGWQLHFDIEVTCRLWTNGTAGSGIDCAMSLLPTRLAMAGENPTLWVTTLPGTVDGRLLASPAGVIYETPGLILHLAYNRHSHFAQQAIDRPTRLWVPEPAGLMAD